MGDVVEFRKPANPSDQYANGPAFCNSCGHKWKAVAAVGATQLECPECHTLKGRWLLNFAPSPGELVKQCKCGNQLFFATLHGLMCIECGITLREE